MWADVEILRIIAGLADQRGEVKMRLDFVDAFTAFEEFTQLNELNPKSYENYFTCLNVLVNLCSLSEPTWSDRMDVYLRTYSFREMRRAKYQTLRARLDSFDNKTKDRFLGLWYEAYIVLEEKDRQMTEVAESYDYATTISAALRVWFYRYQKLKDQREEATKKEGLKLKQKCLNKLLQNTRLVAEDKIYADQLAIRNHLRIWTERYREVKNQAEMADLVYERALKERAFRALDQTHSELEAERIYNTKIAHFAISTWKSRLEYVYKMESAAISNERVTSIYDAFHVWESRNRSIESMNRTAYQMYDKSILTRVFEIWKSKSKYDRLLAEFLEKKDAQAKKDILNEWKTRSELVYTSRVLGQYNVCKKVFKQWRLECRSQRVVSISNDEMLSTAFHNWRLESKLNLYVKVKNTDIASEVLDYWRRAREQVELNTYKQYSSFLLAQNSKLASKIIGAWHSHFVDIEERQDEADAIYHKNIAQHGLYLLIYRFNSIKENEEKADEICNTRTFKKYIGLWKKKKKTVQKQRQQELLEQYESERDLRLKEKYLYVWVERVVRIDDMNSVCNQMLDDQELGFQRDALNIWLDAQESIERNGRIAEAQYSQSILSRTFDEWKLQSTRLSELQAQADILAAESHQQLLERVYRLWRMRMFKLKTKARDADDFHKQVQTQRLRQIWRHWKARAREDDTTRIIHQENLDRYTRSTVRRPVFDSIGLAGGSERAVEKMREYVLQTPTKQRSRNQVPLTSLGRWRRNRTPAYGGYGTHQFEDMIQEARRSPTEGRM